MIDWLAAPLESAVVTRALAELVLIGVISGALGCWVVLRGMSYSAESLAHGMLPGLVLAALAGIPLAVGGAGGLLVATLAIAAAGRIPRLDGEVAVSAVITTMVGLGALLALSPRTPAGLGEILFGDVLGVTDGDLLLTGAAAVLVPIVLWTLHGGLLVCAFDPQGAGALRLRPAVYDVALALLLAVATLVAVQALGSLLVVAMLVGPAATARLVCRRIGPMMIVAGLFAIAAAVCGLYLSYHAQTGAAASVAVAVTAIYVLTLGSRAVVPPAWRAAA